MRCSLNLLILRPHGFEGRGLLWPIPRGFTTPRGGTPVRDQPVPKHPRSGLRARGIPGAKRRLGAGALRAGLHHVEPECAVVVDIDQNAQPVGNSRAVDPEGVDALRAGVRTIEDLVPEGIGGPAWAVAKYMAARNVQRRAEVPDAGDPRRYAVAAELVLKPGHVTYINATESDPHTTVLLAHNGPGRQPPGPRAVARRPGTSAAGNQSRHGQRQGGTVPAAPARPGSRRC